MLRNYLLITIAVMKRRKFFTFISLFGISITLLIMMVLAAFIDHVLGAGYPEQNRGRSLYINRVELTDSLNNWHNISPASFYLLNTYLPTLKTPEAYALTTNFDYANAFVNGKKLALRLKYTNADFWKILRFNFLEGRPYQLQEVNDGAKTIVLGEATAEDYFGTATGIVGQNFELDNVIYKVVGIIKDVPATRLFSSADVYLPYSNYKGDLNKKEYTGNFMAILMAPDKSQVKAMQAEFDAMAAKLKHIQQGELTRLKFEAAPYLDTFTENLLGGNSSIFYVLITLLALMFMLLPAINLVNINMSRIIERASEIGVRKAFGASSKHLVLQFIAENIFITMLGGLFAFLLSGLTLFIINKSQIIPYSDLQFNLKIFVLSLLMCLIFGLLSGVYPAWRMSKMQVTDALRGV